MRRGDKNPDVLQSILLFLSRLATSCLNRSSFTTLHGPHDLLLITLYPYLGVLVPVVCRRPIFSVLGPQVLMSTSRQFLNSIPYAKNFG